jgi:DtxR family transcriptional regulator, Mn-dependent transcriptional regulator
MKLSSAHQTTPVLERYLEFIYLMAVEEEPIISARLAKSLHVSRPSVTATLKRMVRERLVKFNPRKEIQLTAKGQELAEYLQRRHCIIERWLTEELGLSWEESDAQAHQLEHAMSDLVAEKLNLHLGSPATCPHGNPIPGNGSVLADPNISQLSRAEEGDRIIVMRISEYDADVVELLSYLGKRDIKPGALLEVTETAPFNGPLTLKMGAQVVSMSREVANFIWVKEAK